MIVAKKGRLLIVDDEKGILFFLQKMFQKKSYLVEIRSTAKEALDALSNEKFDILITDVRMPVMDGIELLKMAKQLQPELEGMIISGHDDIDSAINALKLGAVNYFRKPLNFEEIELGVSRCLKNMKLKQDLRQNEICFKSIINNSSSLISIKDKDSRYLLVNKQFEKAFHVNNEEIVSKTDFDIFSEELAMSLSAHDSEILKDDISRQFEEVFYINDQKQTYVANKFPLLKCDDSCYALCSIATDVSELIQTQQRLQKSQAKYHAYLNESIDGFFIADLQGNFIEANPAYCKTVGYSLEELRHMSIVDLVANKTPEGFKHRSKKIVQVGNDRFETKYRRKDGTLVDLWISAHYKKELDGVFFVFVREISERKRVLKELQASRDNLDKRVTERTQELEKAYQQLLHATKLSAIGKLASAIAHEFNNPLNGIQSVFEGIKMSTSLVDEDKNLIDLALLECYRVKKLIQSLQDFNKPTSGVQKNIDIHKLINDVIILCEKDFMTSKVTIRKKLSPNIPLIKVVPDQLKQVILNLLSNAKDALQENGGEVSIVTELRGDRVALHVNDTGSGINAEDMEHIFEPFYSTKPQVKGTGLGLSISYGIVKKHGGDLLVASSPDTGTTFSIILPVNNFKDNSHNE